MHCNSPVNGNLRPRLKLLCVSQVRLVKVTVHFSYTVWKSVSFFMSQEPMSTHWPSCMQRNLKALYTSTGVNPTELMRSEVQLAFTSVRLLSVLRGHSFFSSRHNCQWPLTWKDFLSQILSITLFSYLNSWERASISLLNVWVLNKGTTGTIFITSLVWRGPRLGIEPGASRTRGQHSTTRLSRRWSLTGDWTRDLPHSKPALYH